MQPPDRAIPPFLQFSQGLGEDPPAGAVPQFPPFPQFSQGGGGGGWGSRRLELFHYFHHFHQFHNFRRERGGVSTTWSCSTISAISTIFAAGDGGGCGSRQLELFYFAKSSRGDLRKTFFGGGRGVNWKKKSGANLWKNSVVTSTKFSGEMWETNLAVICKKKYRGGEG